MLIWVHKDFSTIYIYSLKQTSKDYLTVHKLSTDSHEVKVSIVGNNLAAHAGEMLIGC